MAFKGDLTNISLFDVFQTLNQNRQTGVLVVTRDGVTKKIHFSPSGVRIFFSRSFRPLRLGEIFVRRGLVTPQDVEILLLEQKKRYRPIGELLVESGKVPQVDVDQVLRYHAEDEIFEVFGWESGSFAFYDGMGAGESSTPLSEVIMDAAGLCLEAARRLDEMERLREELPSDDEFYIQESDVAIDREATAAHLCAMFDALDKPTNVEELRDLIGLTLFDVLAAMQHLLRGGLIRPLTVEELIFTAQKARDSGRPKREAHALELAYAREPGNRRILEKCVGAARRRGDQRDLARHLARLGSLCLAEENLDDATEFLEQAVRLDASHFEAMDALRDAFAQQGDFERTAEASLRLARAYSDEGQIEKAVHACESGLETVPEAIPLRFFYGRLLLQTNRTEEATDVLHALIRDTKPSRKTRSEKALELQASCFRMLLKMDPEDEQAKRGLRDLDKDRVSSIRRRKWVARTGVAAALLLLAGGIGLTMRGPSAASLYEDILSAQQNNKQERLMELIAELERLHPDSDETARAIALRSSFVTQRSAREVARRKREARLQQEMAAELEEVRAALSDRPYLEAVRALEPFLTRLRRPECGFLRKKMSGHVEYALGTFIERVSEQFRNDRQQVVLAEHDLNTLGSKEPADLLELEIKLASVRGRDWPHLLPELFKSLTLISTSPHIGKAKQAIAEFHAQVEGTKTSFTHLDTLYFTFRSGRLRAEIAQLVALANRDGRNLMRDCEFDKARELYENAYRKADSVTDEEPRKYFSELLRRLEKSNVLHEMRRKRDEIDNIVRALLEVERLRKGGRGDAAFRLLRDIVSDFRLVEFEQKFKMPYQIISTPRGAEVRVGGEAKGVTPCTIEIAIDKTTQVSVGRAGFATQKVDLLPLDPELNGTLDVDLEKKLAWSVEIQGDVQAPPAFTDRLLLVATANAALLGLDLKDGSRLWEAETKLLDRITAAPVVAGELAYVATVGGKLHRVRLSDGEIVGRTQLAGQVHHAGVFDGDLLYVATRGPRLIAIRGDDVVYSVPLALSPSTSLVLHDGLLYVGTAEGYVLVHDAKTGKERARVKAKSGSSFFGGIAHHAGFVLAGAEDGKLYAFDVGAREVKWQYPTSGPLTAPATGAGELIYVPARDGYIHAVTPKGQVEIKYDMGNSVEATPALANGFLYGIAGDRVRAFDTRAEKVWWGRRFEGEAPLHVAASENHVVVVTDKPWIYVFAKDSR